MRYGCAQVVSTCHRLMQDERLEHMQLGTMRPSRSLVGHSQSIVISLGNYHLARRMKGAILSLIHILALVQNAHGQCAFFYLSLTQRGRDLTHPIHTSQ